MPQISVVMPVYNGSKYIAEAIESVLKQSFDDFEFIIIDDGSNDETLFIIRSFKDRRITVIENEHDFIDSLNKGINLASGKYIARMDADDIMHIDRLKVQNSIMEEESNITICGSWMIPFGDNMQAGQVIGVLSGVIEKPMIEMLKGNYLFPPTVMVRKHFLKSTNIQYERDYPYAEDYKLWFEIVKQGAVIYIESQPLLYYRVSEIQLSNVKSEEQKQTVGLIKREIIKWLMHRMPSEIKHCLIQLEEVLWQLEDFGVVGKGEVYQLFLKLFNKSQVDLNTQLNKLLT